MKNKVKIRCLCKLFQKQIYYYLLLHILLEGYSFINLIKIMNIILAPLCMIFLHASSHIAKSSLSFLKHSFLLLSLTYCFYIYPTTLAATFLSSLQAHFDMKCWCSLRFNPRISLLSIVSL